MNFWDRTLVGLVRQRIFNIAIHSTGRVLLVRDLLLGRVKRRWEIGPADVGFSQQAIPSGRHLVDAVLAVPESGEARAAVLLCHGIGETVQHWIGVQRLLAEQGVASLVFDYAGYGRSTGFFNARQSEEDAVAAFHFLRERVVALPVALLGFSLGSGIAVAVLDRVRADGLVLGAAFTSLRNGARSVGIPGWLGFGVPPIWRTEETLRACSVPVLLVHGDRDRLFPVSMAMALKDCCGSEAELVIVPGLAHDEPFYRPTASYWDRVAGFATGLPKLDDTTAAVPLRTIP
jgi:alpha-beta hydrolase superfamily lysophospholipase